MNRPSGIGNLKSWIGNRQSRIGNRTAQWLCLAIACAGAACAVDPVNTPLATGPSEFALSLAVSATPDVIPQDGTSQSSISILARDAASRPVAGLTLRADTLVNGTVIDYGTLSSRWLSTASDGRALVTYLAPPKPPPTVTTDTTVTVRVMAVGGNYANTAPRTVAILLMRPGVILPPPPPNKAPIPSFFFSPTTAKENEDVRFDGTASTDDGTIVSYLWQFGDGSSGSGSRDGHRYSLAGTYKVTLTVTDDKGLSASSEPQTLTVVAAPEPVASFTFSPTNPQVGTSIVFNAAASTAPTGRTIVSYEWEFGDGGQATGVAPLHTFTQARVFTVVLVVTDNTGRRSVASRTVTVLPPGRP